MKAMSLPEIRTSLGCWVAERNRLRISPPDSERVSTSAPHRCSESSPWTCHAADLPSVAAAMW